MPATNLPLKPLFIPDLPAHLQGLIAQIPRGRVSTYGRLAMALGSRTAARWVGEYLRDHPHTEACPCHRVVRVDGEVGQTILSDPAEKIRLLEAEGVTVLAGQVTPLDAFLFDMFQVETFPKGDPHGAPPLAALQRLQAELATQFRMESWAALPEFAAGVDVSYAKNGDAFAAYTLVEVATGKLAWSHVRRQPPLFPYITGFLSFRELPALLPLLEEVAVAGKLADVVLVDGNGRLHPLLLGIASHLGIVADLPTIGIAKRLICGQIDHQTGTPTTGHPILLNDEPIAMAMQAGPQSNPIFVSPGHRVDLPFAVNLVRNLFHGHRLPEPQYLADRLSREAATSS